MRATRKRKGAPSYKVKLPLGFWLKINKLRPCEGPSHTQAMGIQSLLPSLKSITRTIHVGDAYSGKRVAIDSYCWLHRGAYSCSTELVEGIPTEK